MPRYEFVGSEYATPNDLVLGARATIFGETPMKVFPDVDTSFSAAGIASPGKLRFTRVDVSRLTAVALGPRSGWQAVRVRVEGEIVGYLGPGRVLYFPRPVDHFDVEPIIQCPANRLIAAKGLDYPRLPKLPAGIWAIDAFGNLFNASAVTQRFYIWDGTKYTLSAGTIAGATVTNIDNALMARPVDISPDGVWPFSEYFAAGQIPNASGVTFTFVSRFALDSSGNLGDPTQPTTLPFVSAFGSSIDTRYFGPLELELWENERPPAGYIPLTLSERVYTLPRIVVPAAVKVTADNPVLTLPVQNAGDVQFDFQQETGADLIACLGMPNADEGINVASTLLDGDSGGPAVAKSTNANKEVASLLLTPVVKPWVQLILAGSGGQSTLRAGATLTIRTRFSGR